MDSHHDNSVPVFRGERRPEKFYKKYFKWISFITIEPTMWLFMMAYMITNIVEQDLFIYKACTVDHGYSDKECLNIKKNKTIETSVQITVSTFHQWNDIAGHLIPIILALFFGNWSDRRGRKLPLIIGLIGKTIYSGMIVVNTLMPNWNVFMIIYTATIPMSFLGGDVAIFASCFAYISDISSATKRTMRVTILDIVYLSAMPTGIALGSYLFTSVFIHSYTKMFIINTTLLIFSIIYSSIVLKMRTNDQQKSLKDVNILKDFFDKEHVVETVKTLVKPREGFGRLHLWILFVAMMLYTIQRDEKNKSYLYTQRFFSWELKQFSTFKTFYSTVFIITMVIIGPLLSRVLGLKDTIIICIGALSHSIGRIFFALASSPTLFYAGALAAAIGPIVAPVLRSMISKTVPINERGKVFAILSVCDNAVPFFSGILYTQIYNSSYHTLPNAIYWFTMSTQIAVFLLILIVHFTSRSNQQQMDNSISEASDIIN